MVEHLLDRLESLLDGQLALVREHLLILLLRCRRGVEDLERIRRGEGRRGRATVSEISREQKRARAYMQITTPSVVLS